jgi:hypothetical protein
MAGAARRHEHAHPILMAGTRPGNSPCPTRSNCSPTTAADPSNTEWQRDLSVFHERIGNMLVTQGKLDDALKACP